MDTKALLGRLWNDRCKVIVRSAVTDPDSKLTDFTESVLIDNEPCRLSFESLVAADADNVAAISQATKLFLSPEIDIPPGSKIEVRRFGRTTAHTQSGPAAVYSGHQEIPLALFARWA